MKEEYELMTYESYLYVENIIDKCLKQGNNDTKKLMNDGEADV
jgi:hypothetical protein